MNIQTFEHSNIRPSKHSNTEPFKQLNIWAFKRLNIQTFEHSTNQTFDHSNIQPFKHWMGFWSIEAATKRFFSPSWQKERKAFCWTVENQFDPFKLLQKMWRFFSIAFLRLSDLFQIEFFSLSHFRFLQSFFYCYSTKICYLQKYFHEPLLNNYRHQCFTMVYNTICNYACVVLCAHPSLC